MRLPSGDRELIQIMDAALADAALLAGSRLACRPGCTQCCHGVFAINALDTLRLRAGMKALRCADPTAAAQIQARAAAWIAEYGPEFPGDRETGVLGAGEEDQERFEEFANDAACPALDPETGRCAVYAWRPLTCRVFGPPVRMAEGDSIGCCELCFVGASEQEIAACVMPVPHDVEQQLLAALPQQGDTVVAFALRG